MSFFISPLPFARVAAASAEEPAEIYAQNSTQEVNGAIRLIIDQVQGDYISEVIAYKKTVAWDVITWTESEPTLVKQDYFSVMEETENMIDGQSRIGIAVDGSLAEVAGSNGVYETISENVEIARPVVEEVVAQENVADGTIVIEETQPVVDVTIIVENTQPAVEETVQSENVTVVEETVAPATEPVTEAQTTEVVEQPVEQVPAEPTVETATTENVETVIEEQPVASETSIEYPAVEFQTPVAPAADQKLRWQHAIAGIQTGYDAYALKVRGYTSDGEAVEVYVWNGASWEAIGQLGADEQTIEKAISGGQISGYLVDGKMYVKYEDASADENVTSLYIDLCTVEASKAYTSDVKVQVRVSSDNVAWSEWLGPDGTSATYFVASPGDLSKVPVGKYIQYRVYLSSGDAELSGEGGPSASNVQIESAQYVAGRRISKSAKRATIGNLAKGVKGEADFSAYGMPLKKVKISARQAVGDLEVYSEALTTLPTGVPAIEGKRVYAYVEISPTVTNDLIEDADIEFSLPKSWIGESGQIVLYHYDGAAWEELQTSEIGEAANEISYTARTPSFSSFAFVDNATSDFQKENFSENVENVNNQLQLVATYLQGEYESQIFDAGGAADWENIEWTYDERSTYAEEYDYVGAEPTTTKDDNARVGDLVAETSYENTREQDGATLDNYENIRESMAAGGIQYTAMDSKDNENVVEGGVIDTDNAREAVDETEAGGSNYENIYENEYVGYNYTYAQTWDNENSENEGRGWIENFDNQKQLGSGYSALLEGPISVYTQLKAIAVYSAGTETPAAKEWNGSAWVSMTAPNSVGDIVEWIVVKSAKTRNEMALGTLDAGGNISVQIWNGVTGTWSAPEVMSNVGTTNDAYRGFDIEYENGTDRAIVVYNNNNDTDFLGYNIWDGNSWAGENTIDVPTTGVPYWVELASNPLPDNNDIAMIVLDANSDVWGARWDGTTWDNMGDSAVWDDNAAIATRKAMDVAYESTTGDAMFVWGSATAGSDNYRTWNGSTLSPSATLANGTLAVVNWIQLASDPNGDNILYAFQNATPDFYSIFWDGNFWGSSLVVEAGTETAADPNFAATFLTDPDNNGHALALFGNGALLENNGWNGTAWTTTAGTNDDTARVVMESHWYSGVVLAIVMGDDSSAAAYDGIYAVQLIDGAGTWESGGVWVASELPPNPIFERAGISSRRHWPTYYGLSVYENIDNIPAADNYDFEIYYRTSNTNDWFHVEVENYASGKWERVGDLTSDTWATFTYRLDPTTQLLGGENLHMRIIDNDNTKESITDLYVDYTRVAGAKIAYRLDVEHSIMAPSGADNYIVQVGYYIGDDGENVDVYLWEFEVGEWQYVGELTSTTPTQWTYDITGTAYILGTGKVRVRYVQDDIDTTTTSFMINYTRVRSQSVAGASMRWQHTITNVTTAYDNYDLKIVGKTSGDSEYINVYVWDNENREWDYIGYMRSTEDTITYRLAPITAYLDVDNVYVLFDDDSDSDSNQTTLHLDMVRLDEAFSATSDIRLQVRTSTDNIEWTEWTGPDNTSGTYFENDENTDLNTGRGMIPNGDNRFIQYKVYFTSQYSGLTAENGPTVYDVTITASTFENLYLPANGSVTTDNTPYFEWENVNADNYNIQIDSDTDYQDPVYDNNVTDNFNTIGDENSLEDNLYYWRVRRQLAGVSGAWTNSWSFRVDTLAPGAPENLNPSSGENYADNTPFLDWDAPDENSTPLQYIVWVSRYSDFGDTVWMSGWLDEDNVTIPEVDDNDNYYYWRVRARDNLGNENAQAWSAYGSFRVDTTAPNSPSLSWPGDTSWVSATPNLDWSTVTDNTNPVWYSAIIASDPTFSGPSIVENSGWITDDNYETTAQPHATYRYWLVIARDNLGNESIWSDNRSYRADTNPPQIVQLNYPSENQEVETYSITFDWPAVTDDGSGVDNYWIQIDDDNTFATPLHENNAIPASENYYNNYTMSGSGVYYWRVKAIDKIMNENDWSDNWMFACRQWFIVESWGGTINAPLQAGWSLVEGWDGTATNATLWNMVENWGGTITAIVPAPTLTAPFNNENTNDTTPTFSWENSQPADTYQIWADDDPDFQSPDVNPGAQGAKSYTPFSPMSDGLYYWRVSMTRTGSTSENSENWIVRIDTSTPTGPNLVSPFNNENSSDNTPNLDWESVSDPSQPVVYEIWVARDSSFQDIVVSENGVSDDNYEVASELDDNQYYWRVRTWDNAGNPSDNAENCFRMDTLAPDTPTQLWPINDQWTITTPNLNWSAVVDNSQPVEYYVIVSGDNSAVTYNSGWITDDNWVTPALVQEDWYWWVQARDNAGNLSGESNRHRFQVDTTPPNVVSITKPDNMEAFTSLSVVMTWAAGSDNAPGSGIENYYIQIDDDPDFSSLIHENAAIPSSETSYTYDFSGLGTYYWHVRAIDAVGNQGDMSENYTIRIATWSIVEGWAGTVESTVPVWQVVEAWDGTITTSATWQIVESWAGTITTSATWQIVESWAGTIASVTPVWAIVESWDGTITTNPTWQIVESWAGTITTSTTWQIVESWSGTIATNPTWQIVESWAGTITANATWQIVESWAGTIASVTPVWAIVESWDGTITTNPTWQIVESWAGTITSVTTSWQVVEAWDGTITANATWQIVESWAGTITTSATWQIVEMWIGVIGAPVPAPTLSSPATGSTINTNLTALILDWENSQAADSYTLQIDNDYNGIPDFSDYIEYSTVVSQKTVVGLDDGLYFWQVTMTRTGGTSSWSDNWSFRVDTLAPNAPNIVSPIDGENVPDNTPFLDWDNVDENSLPLTYEVEIARDASYTDIAVAENVQTENWTVSPDLEDNFYYWHVRVWDNAESAGNWSTGTFRVDTLAPATPTHLLPDNNVWTTGTPTFYWTSVNDNSLPVLYYAEVAIDTDFIGLQDNSGWTTDNSWTSGFLPAGDIYYWHVKSMDNAGNVSNWSDAWQFRTDPTEPNQVTTSKPENMEAFADWAVLMTWAHPTDMPVGWNSGVENYWIQIDNDEDFGSPLSENAGIPVAENTYVYTFTEAGSYYWHVRAVDAVGNQGAWSEPRIVRISLWRVVESWTGTVASVTPTWAAVESWTGTVTTSAIWQVVETWNATITTAAVWQVVETWDGTVTANAAWQSVESWTGTITNTPIWSVVESWSGTVTANATWLEVESWSGTISAPVLAPTLVDPPNNSGSASTFITFTWVPISLADNYNIQIDYENDFSPVDITDNWDADNSFSFDLENTGTYYWRVMAYVYYENGPWSEIWKFSVDITPPDAPNLVSPYHRENTSDNTPLLTWELVAENSYPVSYYVKVYNAGTAGEVASTTLSDDNQWAVSPELPDNEYFWKVKGVDSANNSSPYSTEWYFRVDTLAPEVPVLTSPDNKFSTYQTNVTLTWNSVNENSLPVVYYAAVSDNDQFPYENNNSGWTENTSWNVDISDGVWYWRVKARDNAGNEGSFSDPWWVRIDIDGPSATQLTSPSSGTATGDNTPSLDWAVVDNENTGAPEDSLPVIYYVAVSDDQAFTYENDNSGWISDDNWDTNELADGVWYWRVRTQDNATNVGDWSENWQIIVDTTPPSTPQPGLPQNGENTNDTTPRLEWTRSSDLTAVTYYAWVATDNLFQEMVTESGWISDNYWDANPALADNSYYWTVVARDNAGRLGDNSDNFAFRVDTTPPAAPTATWPVVAKTNDNSPNFQWTAPSENSLPVTYWVWVLDDTGNFIVTQSASWSTDENWTPASELSDGEYYWTVAARDGAGNPGDNCGNKWFRVDIMPPAAPTQSTPIEGENVNDNTPPLNWDAVTTENDSTFEYSLPVIYKVWIATDNDFTNIAAESSWLSDDNWETSPELDDNVYYWKVQARDDATNDGDNSTIRSFRIDTLAPENVSLIWPDNAQLTGVGTTPNLDWAGAIDNLPVLYQVVLSTYPGFDDNTRDSGWITDDNWEVTPPLTDNDYYWKVTAMDNAGNAFETGPRWFRVETQAPPVPSLYFPISEDNVNDNTPLLEWENVWDISLPVSFYVWIAKDNEFQNIVVESGWLENENFWTPSELEDNENVYYWRVWVKDSANNYQTENSDNGTFRIDTLAPAQVSLYVPNDNYGSENYTVYFEWDYLVDNSGVIYRIQIDDSRDFATPLHDNENVYDNNYLYELPITGVYYWRVLAMDSAGNAAAWSENYVLAIAHWNEVEIWTATITANSTWREVESWAGTITANATWQIVESWAGTITTSATWQVVDAWGETITTNPTWQIVESWAGTITGNAAWREVESWSGTITATSWWYLVESWDGTITTSATWQIVESWAGTITTSATWQIVESWGGTIGNVTMWSQVESWAGTITTSATWQVVDAWTGVIYVTGPAPTPALPINGLRTNDNTVTFGWDNTWLAENWEIWIDNDADFSSPELVENTTDNTYTSAALGDENYFWMVRGWNFSSTSVYSDNWTVLVDTMPPETPAKSAPSTDTITVNLTNTFSWIAVYDNSYALDSENAGVEHYEIIIDNDGNFASNEHYDNTITSTSKFITLDPGIYQWIIRAWDYAGNVSDNQGPWTITIDNTGPQAPTLTTPIDGAMTNQTANITFDWSDAVDDFAGIDYYHILVDNDNDFSSPTAETYPGSSQETLTLNADENYTWKVQAYDRAGNAGTWSTNFTMLIDTSAPDVPTKSVPADNYTTNNVAITFEWATTTDNSNSLTGENAGVAYYEIWVDNDEDFSSPENLENLASPDNDYASTFADENYFWRVRAWDNAGNAGNFESYWSFIVDTTAPEVPTLLTPGDNSATSDNTTTFTWAAPYDLAGIENYEILIDNDPDFSSPENIENVTDTTFTSTELSDENYFWKVRAYDIFGLVGGFSENWVVLVETGIPATSDGSSSDGLVTKQNNPTIYWNAVADTTNSPTGEEAGIAYYEIEIDNDGDFSSVYKAQLSADTQFDPVSDDNYPGAGFEDENYSFRVRAWDNAGNAAIWSNTWTFIVDMTPPDAPTQTSPENEKMLNNGTVQLQWTQPSDLSGVNQYRVFLDNDPDFSSENSYLVTVNFKEVTLPDEVYYWRVMARDSATNWGENSGDFNFIIDTVVPETPTLGFPADELETKENNQTFGWSYVNDQSGSPTGETAGVVAYEVWIDNDSDWISPALQENRTDNSRTIELEDELYYWRVRVWDNAGNYVDSATRSVLIDTRAPDNTSLLTPANGTKTNDSTPTLDWTDIVDWSWSATDENSGVVQYEIWIDNDDDFGSTEYLENRGTTSDFTPTLTDENYSWKVRVWDNAGNVSAFSSTWTILVDTVAPSTPAKSSVSQDTGVDDPKENTITNDNSIQFVWAGTTDTSSSPTGESAGVSYYEIIVDDDFVEPYIASENVSGTNTTITELPEGELSWIVRAWDNSGNVGDNEAPWLLIIDITAPDKPTLASPSDGLKTNRSEWTLDWADSTDNYGIPTRDDDSTPAYQIAVDNDDDFSSTFDSTSLDTSYYTAFNFFDPDTGTADENWHWRVRVTDNAGNVSGWSDVWTILIDTAVPGQPDNLAPENNEVILTADVTIDWQTVADYTNSLADNASGVQNYEVWIDNDSDFSSPENVENTAHPTSIWTTTLSDSEYYWRVRAFDYAGNASGYKDFWRIIVDNNAPPTSTLTSISDGTETNDNTPTLDWENVYDVTGVKFEIWIDNDDNFSSPENIENINDNTYTTTELSDENYFWKVRAWDGTDKAGEFTGYWSILIDTVAPEIPSASPEDGVITNDNLLQLNWSSVSDSSNSPTGEASGVWRYEIWLDNDSDFGSVEYQSLSADNIFMSGDDNYPAAGIPEENYSYRIRSIDEAGNVSDWSTLWSFVVDRTAPDAPVLGTPENNAAENYVVGSYVYVTHDWNDVEDASGIDNYMIEVDNDPDFLSKLADTAFVPSTPSSIKVSNITVKYADDERYYWHVRAADRAGMIGDWSETWEVVIDRVLPPTPALYGLENGRLTSDNTPMLYWDNVTDNTDITEDVSGLENYIVEIDTDPNYAAPMTFTTLRENWLTLPDENSLAVGTYYWRVRAADRAGNQGNWSENFTFTVEDLVISVGLSDNTLNPSQSFTISGYVNWEPDNIISENTAVSIYVDNVLENTVTTDNEGNYTYRYATSNIGEHEIKVAVTDNDGIYDENIVPFKVEKQVVTIAIDDAVVNPSQIINVSGNVTRTPDNVPETSATITIYIDDSPQTSVSPDENGNYATTVTAPTTIGDHMIKAYAVNPDGIDGENQTSFIVKRIDITVEIERYEANPNEMLRIWGNATLQPDGTPIMLTSVSILRDNVPVGSATTTMTGYFENTITAPAALGIYEYRIMITGTDLIMGENTANLTVKMIELSINYSDGVLNPGESDNVYGTAILRPDNTPVDNRTVTFNIVDPDTQLPVGGATGTTDAAGYFSLPFEAPDTAKTYIGRVLISYGNFSQDNDKDLYVKTIDVSLVFADNVVNLNDVVNMSGTATLTPDNTPVGSTNLEIWRSGLYFDLTVTDENGNFTYTYNVESTAPENRYIAAKIVNTDGITGENTQTFDKRIVDLPWFGIYDAYQQFDGVISPGENFYPAVQICEFNGTEYFPVTSALSKTMKISGTTYGLVHIDNGYWRTLDAFTASAELGDNTILDIDTSLLTANSIIGSAYDNTATYSVKSLDIPVYSTDYVVNLGENAVYAYGTVTLQPESTAVDGQTVTVTLNGVEENVTTDENGYYSQLLTIPSVAGAYELKVIMLDNRGLYQENTATINVKLIDLPLIPQGAVAEEGVPFTFTGQALRQPDNIPIPNTDISVFIDNVLVTTVQTIENGDYEFSYTFATRGIYNVKIEMVDADNLAVENSMNLLAGRPITIYGEIKNNVTGVPIGTTMNFYDVETDVKSFDIATDNEGSYSEEVFAGNFNVEINVPENGFTAEYENLNLDGFEAYENIENFVKIANPSPAYAAITGAKDTLVFVVVDVNDVFTDNFENLNITYDFSPYLSSIGDVHQLIIYKYSWIMENNIGENLVTLGGTIDTSLNRITASDTDFRKTTAYILAENDPQEATFATLENATAVMTAAAESLASSAAAAGAAVEELQETVENIVTQEDLENIATQENVAGLTDNVSSIADNIPGLATQENIENVVTQTDIENVATQESVNTVSSNVNTVSSGVSSIASTLSTLATQDNVSGLSDNVSSIADNIPGLATQDNVNSLSSTLDNVQSGVSGLAMKDNLSVSPSSIYIEIRQGDSTRTYLTVKNILTTAMQITIESTGAVKDKQLISFGTTTTTLQSNESANINVDVTVEDSNENRIDEGSYTGYVVFKDSDGVVQAQIPVTIRVFERRRGMFDMQVVPLSSAIIPGDNVPFEVQLKNMGIDPSDAEITFNLVDSSGNIIDTISETVLVNPNDTVIKQYTFKIPENAPLGNYLIKGTGNYQYGSTPFTMSAAKSIEVNYPPEELKVLGIPIGILIAMVVGLISAGTTGYFVYRYHKKRTAGKRRFEAKIFLNELPQPGPETIKFGTLAEAKQDALLGLGDMKMHTMTAGATGGGKSISSMVIAEEALIKGKNVIVFDPTAQWTGFLRKCTDQKMLSFYPKFGMKDSEARSFPGVVKIITNPRQMIDMKALLGEEARGKITVFVTERLKPSDIDIFVTNVIQSIFESQPLEYPELKTLLVFDEAHRLLPRFGGSGAGTIQLERAVREFRKWGMGILIVSQVMGDFPEEVRTNIRTQVQFWTRETAELGRIEKTYGEEHVRSVSKAPIGFGMVVNPDYNRGRPYYVNFRPILHAVRRLTPDELDKYYGADDRIETVKYKLKKLEQKGVDVFDLRIELGLAQRKLEEASFDMVAAYMDSLEPRVEDVCARHGLKGLKREIQLRPEADIKKAQMAAIKERESRLGGKRSPEIVEAYKEMLAPAKEVTHGEVSKPLKPGDVKKEAEVVQPGTAEATAEVVHPDAAEEGSGEPKIERTEKLQKLDLKKLKQENGHKASLKKLKDETAQKMDLKKIKEDTSGKHAKKNGKATNGKKAANGKATKNGKNEKGKK